MNNPPNKRIGDYEILSELGRGGMGRVYKVRNLISDRVEAMKILLPELAGRQELAARFLREIKLVASLNHPNIGQLRTALTLDDQLVMIMEFVEGTSLDERIKQGPLPVADAVNYTDQALRALSHAHKQGVVHRDIKPANLMLTPEGVIKVMDFGIAFSGREQKLTSTGTTMGSLPYMSPEQVKGEGADLRSDLYSLGISLYEMVTGQRPFNAESDFAIMAAHIKETPRAPIELQPGVPTGLNEVILRAIAKEKEQRFQTADEFRQALSTAAAGAKDERTVVFTPSTPVPVAGRTPETVYSHPAAEPVPATMPPARSATAPGTTVTNLTGAGAAAASVPAAAPAASVAAPPAPPVQPAGSGSHRVLYMTIGAVLALALLVVAGTYYRSSAGGAKQEPATMASAPTMEPAAQPAPTPAVEPAAAPPAAAEPAPAAAKPKVVSSQPAPAAAVPAAKPVETAPAVPDNSAQLDELENQIDQLTARALAVDSSLETLRQQQRASGYDLRSDIAAKQEGMKLNLLKARQAWEKRDDVRGKKYADQAENLLGQLEKFLGR